MNQAQATTAILQRWMTLWPGLSSSVPFVFDNDIVYDSPTYARVAITMLGSDQHTLGAPGGSRKWLRDGLINVKLYGPSDQGRIGLDVLAAFVKTIYEGARFGTTGGGEEGVVCYALAVTEIRPQTDSQYWILNCSVSFEFYEQR